MAHKKQHRGPVPPGNQSHSGPAHSAEEVQQQPQAEGAPSQEQDAKRRLGDFTGTGEHSLQQPGGHNDANH